MGISVESAPAPLPPKLLLRDHAACALLAVLCVGQMTALGAGPDALAALAAVADIGCALAICLMLGLCFPPDGWRRMAPAALLFGAAALWAALPLIDGRPPSPQRPVPGAAALELVKLAGAGACVFSGALVGASQRRRSRTARWFVWAGLAWTLLGLWMRQADAGHVFGLERAPPGARFSGTLLNANAAACLFGMIALIALALLRRDLLSGRRTATPGALGRLAPSALAAALAFAACAFTGSRFTLACALLLSTAMSLSGIGRMRARGRIRALAPAVTAVVIAAAASDVVLSRAGNVEEDWRGRTSLLAHFAAIAVHAPLQGYGLGGFDTVNAMTLRPADATRLWELGAAHDILLQAVIEGGWPYAALLAATLLVVAFQAAAPAAAAAPYGAVRTGFIAAAGLALLCSVIDIALQVPAVSALACVCLGLAWGGGAGRAPAPAQPTA